MKILGISGSPRRGGNTEILLDEVLKGAKSAGLTVEKIALGELAFKPCQECGGCDNIGRCVILDDMAGVYNKVESADAVIIASPIFFGSLSAQTKMMIDRFQALWVKKYILKTPPRSGRRRKGVILCAANSKKRKFFKNAESIVKNLFATLDIDYVEGLFCGGLEGRDAIKSKKRILKKAFSLGAGLASV